jgi:tuberous sclerosis 2
VWSETAPSQRRKDVAIDPSFFALQLSSYPTKEIAVRGRLVKNRAMFDKFKRTFDYMPVIDTHKVGVLYVAPGQKTEAEILRNTHGSPAYTRFLENLGRLIFLRGQKDVYMGDLIPGIDGDYAYAWWDDIGQTVYHTATLMPNPKDADDPNRDRKKALIGNDFVRIVWNDSGAPYPFDMLKTDFQFVNIVIEPHSVGAVAAFSNNMHEHEYFKLTIQRAPKMVAFTPLGDFKIISAEGLPFFVRQLGLHSDWFAKIFSETNGDTLQREIQTNWRARLGAIRRFSRNVKADYDDEAEIPQSIGEGVLAQLPYRDFTTGL